MTEAVGAAVTATMTISPKEAGPKTKTWVDDLILTAKSPMGWLLLLALVVTWGCVAVVLFDLLDYKTLTGMAPPPPAIRRVQKRVGGLRAGEMKMVSPVVVEETAEPTESTDWLSLLINFASSLVAPEEEGEEGVEALVHAEDEL